MADSRIMVLEFSNPQEAEMARGRLQAAGIPVGEDPSDGGGKAVRLQVAEADWGRAQEILTGPLPDETSPDALPAQPRPAVWLAALALLIGMAGWGIYSYLKSFRRDPVAAQKRLDSGMAHEQAKEYDQALADLDEAIRLDPTLSMAFYYRGAVHATLGHRDQALDDLGESVRLNPLFASAWYARGMVRQGNREFGRAVEDFSAAIKADPDTPGFYYFRGLAYVGLQQPDPAVADFTKALDLGLRSAAVHLVRGNAYLDKKDVARAVDDYTQGILLNPDHGTLISLFFQRGIARVTNPTRAELEGAVDDFTRVIVLAPKDVQAYHNRGQANNSLGKYEAAVVDFQKAIQLDPKNPLSHMSLAWLRATCPDPKFRDGGQALADAKKSCDLAQWKDPFCLGSLAAAYAEQGNFTEAVKWQKKALEYPDAYGPEGVSKGKARLKEYEGGKPHREEAETGE